MNIRETENFKRGHVGELKFSDWLQKRGCYVIPSYDYSGDDDHPPRMECKLKKLVVPDLDVSKGGKRVWLEVKTKKEPTVYRKTNTVEHGISKRHYEHYLAVEKESGCKVFLGVYEEDCGAYLIRSLAGLGEPRTYNGQMMGVHGMVFWPRGRFKEIVP